MALKGIRVLELSGLAPVPFCGMILGDLGASVIRVDRLQSLPPIDGLSRGKRSISLDLRHSKGCDVFKKLSKISDVLIDPYRPGVLEKLGLGPTVLQGLNPKLIFARISGYGQTGPMAHKAGHDINYVAMSGLLSALARNNENPFPPINLLADFAGGGLLCALAICAALHQRNSTGKGEIIDNSMTEGAAYVGSFIWRTQFPKEKLVLPLWTGESGTNLLDGGAAFYQTYKTKDGKYMACGALEPKFYQDLLKGLDLNEDDFPQMSDQSKLADKFSKQFATKTQAEWVEIFEPLDACVTPILALSEAHKHPLHVERQAFFTGGYQPCPKPAPVTGPRPSDWQEPEQGAHTQQVLREAGLNDQEINELVNEGIVEDTNKSSSKL